MGYGVWLHGEAVAAGMVMAARTAELLGTFRPKRQSGSLRCLSAPGCRCADRNPCRRMRICRT